MSVQDSMATPAINFKGDAVFRFLGLPTQVRATAGMTNGAFGLVEHWEMPPDSPRRTIPTIARMSPSTSSRERSPS